MHWLYIIFLFIPSLAHSVEEVGILSKISEFRYGKQFLTRTQKAELDLDALPPNSYLHVKGDVLFVPGEFLEPRFLSKEEFQALLSKPSSLVVSLKDRPYPHAMSGTTLSYGTFLIRVKNKQNRDLYFHPQGTFHPARFFAVDQEKNTLLTKFGTLNKDPSKIEDWYLVSDPVINSFTVDGDFYLYVHASSPLLKGQNTLNMSSFLIGDPVLLVESLSFATDIHRMIVGSFFLLAFFYGFIFSFRPNDRTSLYLSAYALALFILGCLGGIISTKNIHIGIFVSIVNVMAGCFLGQYLVQKMKPFVSRKQYKIMTGLVAFTFISTVITQLVKFQPLLVFSFLFGLIYNYYLIFRTLYIGYREE